MPEARWAPALSTWRQAAPPVPVAASCRLAGVVGCSWRARLKAGSAPGVCNDAAPGKPGSRPKVPARVPLSGGLRLLLVARLVLPDVLLRGVSGKVDLLVVLMVGVALGESRYFVDPLAGLLRVLLGVGLRLLLQVAELAHA